MVKVLVLLAEGFEELEAITVVDILRRAKIEVITTGLKDRKVKSTRRVIVTSETTLDKVNAQDFDMVVLPGGQPGADNLIADERVKELLQTMEKEGKYIAAICAAPYVLSHAGILKNKKATSYPTLQSKLDAAQIIDNQGVVIDDKIITSQGPGTAIDFALELVAILKGQDTTQKIKDAMLHKKF